MQETYGNKWKHMGELNSSTGIGCLAQEDFENSFQKNKCMCAGFTSITVWLKDCVMCSLINP